VLTAVTVHQRRWGKLSSGRGPFSHGEDVLHLRDLLDLRAVEVSFGSCYRAPELSAKTKGLLLFFLAVSVASGVSVLPCHLSAFFIPPRVSFGRGTASFGRLLQGGTDGFCDGFRQLV